MQNEVEVAIAKFIIHNDPKGVIVDYEEGKFTCNEQSISKQSKS